MSVIFTTRLGRENIKASRTPPMGGTFMEGSNGCLAVLIHGLTGTPVELKYLATYLNRRGYSVLCPRLARHGGPIGSLRYATWQEFFASVRDAFEEQYRKSAYESVFVAGLSMGALLALLLADAYPDKVKAVSCLAPTLFYDGWNTPTLKCLLPLACTTPLRYCFFFKEEPPYGIKNEAIRQRIHRYYSAAKLADMANVDQFGYPYFPVALLHELKRLVGHIEKKLSDIKIPVQLIQAKDDDMASIKNSKFIYDRVASEVKEIILLFDSYHVITADQERHVVAEHMERFFGRNCPVRAHEPHQDTKGVVAA